jgi:hypothetical protein
MTLGEYETITGTTVPAGDVDRVTAQIARTQRILETMLGYTLDSTLVDENQYDEIGKTATDCPCPDVDIEDLDPADAVVGSYRLYSYNRHDSFLAIDPATAIYAVKLVKDGITFKTLDTDEYRANLKHGFIKYLQRCEECNWCTCTTECYCVQLAVDGTWLWGEDDTIPSDLLDVWASFVTYYSDAKKDIQSERLGSHSYSKFYDNSKNQPMPLGKPEIDQYNLSVLTKYAGPLGSLHRTITI